jgi:hypothetical protein
VALAPMASSSWPGNPQFAHQHKIECGSELLQLPRC